MRHLASALALSAVVSATGVSAQQPPAAPQRGIVNLTGQLYRAQNNNHYTVFLVTPEGVIMSDPINRDFARWLKAEIATRFKVPVRYVLYTHHDWDHASGGVVFADTAEFVGHRNMLAELALPPGNPPLPGRSREDRRQPNGLVERARRPAPRRPVRGSTSTATGCSAAPRCARPLNDVYPPTIDLHRPSHGDARRQAREMIHLGVAHTRQLGAALPGRTRGVQRRHPAGQAAAGRTRADRRLVDRCARTLPPSTSTALTGHALRARSRTRCSRCGTRGHLEGRRRRRGRRRAWPRSRRH